MNSESPTWWGSRQCMIERFLEHEKAIASIGCRHKKSWHLVPTRQDVEVLESVSKAIGPVLDFINACQPCFKRHYSEDRIEAITARAATELVVLLTEEDGSSQTTINIATSSEPGTADDLRPAKKTNRLPKQSFKAT
ncbi:hypothetical protein N1851_017494 [Merluccius polli]|uniref:Uncharacterized protein n=1 Tax=Merluccius polli TaxID=89951 RepID=A0AA47P255_MERPO|nr:hypothetical protein N1851_017494 [Merluccius polli]